MSSLFEDDAEDTPSPKTNQTEMTVSELSSAVKRTVEDRFGLVRVRAEIGRVSRPRSGHIYLSLKDEKAVIDGVMWKGVASRLAVQPEEGLEVIVTGKLTTFPGQSKYQIVIDKMEPAGAGALMAMLDARRKALQAEGLFAPERKRPIPNLPEVIGVITSPSGAVIRDILHRLADRFPRRVLLWPVAVQGEKCAPEVAAAIRGFDAIAPGGSIPRPDVVIVARGGGSLEDLWGFNEESVVRAAADCRIPLISAIGHETDTSLLDYAADLRAPTPTGAAEKAVPVRAELLAQIDMLSARRIRAMQRSMREARERLTQQSRLLPKPEAILADKRQRLDLAAERLPRALVTSMDRHKAFLTASRASLRPGALVRRVREARATVSGQSKRLHAGASRVMLRSCDAMSERSRRLHLAAPRIALRKRDGLAALTRTLNSLSYLRVLDRGFAVVRDGGGSVVSRADTVATGDALLIEFAGRESVGVTVGDSPAVRPKRARTKTKPKPAATGPEQTDMFE